MNQYYSHIILIFFCHFFSVFCQRKSVQGAKSIYSYPGASNFPINYVLPEDKGYLSSPPVIDPEPSYQSDAYDRYKPKVARNPSSYYQDEMEHRDNGRQDSEPEDTEEEEEDDDDQEQGGMQDENSGSPPTDQNGNIVNNNPGLKQDENPLNFLNLAGTDFQPGRMVNIFFGLLIMIFMIVIHGYILWIVGIAYLPGTRSLQEWHFNSDAMLNVASSVYDAIDYWGNKQVS